MRRQPESEGQDAVAEKLARSSDGSSGDFATSVSACHMQRFLFMDIEICGHVLGFH